MAEEKEDPTRQASERFNNRVALTIAILATFAAIAAIKGSNVGQNIQQAQVSSNDNWAWYQAVRTREDMATYELLRLQQMARNHPARVEARRLADEVKAQQGELDHIRARKDQVQHDAQAADTSLAALNVFDDQYDIATALITISMSLLALCLLAQTRWLYWFAMAPGGAGFVLGLSAMVGMPIHIDALSKLLT